MPTTQIAERTQKKQLIKQGKRNLFLELVAIISNFAVENYFVLVSATLIWAKVMFFNYQAGIMAYFPYILRTIIISGLISFVLFSPAYFFKKNAKKYYSLFLNLFFSLVFIMDIVYLRYFSSLPSVGIFNTLGQAADVLPAVNQLFRYTDLFILTDVGLLLIFNGKIENFVSRFKSDSAQKLKNYQLSLIVTFFFSCFIKRPRFLSA